MPSLGSNFTVSSLPALTAAILKKMGLPTNGMRRRGGVFLRDSSNDSGTTMARRIAIFSKAGAPSSNQANDAPTGVGDLCWDSTNDDVYRCTAYTNATSHTWTKIVD